MITIKHQGSSRYEVFDSDTSIGYISVRCSPYHAQNYYLNLELTQYNSADANELFKLLRSELSRPLQIMLYSWDVDKCVFITSGGFHRKRRCYELEVKATDLKGPIVDSVSIMERKRGHSDYQACCELLYNSYIQSHEAISPLTADKEVFSCDLPDTVLLYQEDCKILHFAFVEENEIAYIGTTRQPGFYYFAQTLLSRMLAKYSSITFECDPTAMELRDFFNAENMDSYDTYIFD